MGHIFTTSPADVAAQSNRTCDYEIVSCWVHARPARGLVPLHCGYNAHSKATCLTTSAAHLSFMIAHQQFANKGICGYVHPQERARTGPLYELYSPQFADYVYTTNWAEVQSAVSNLGYNNLGTVCYVHENQAPGLLALHRLIWLYDSESSVNMIAVAGDAYTQAAWDGFMESYTKAAAIYRKYLLRLRLGGISYTPASESMNRTTLELDSELGLLTNEWSGPEGSVDAFGVALINGETAGISPVDGSCDHDGCRSGIAFEWVSAPRGQILAHELGHYWGLEHDPRKGNLMYEEAGVGYEELDVDQMSKIKTHCTVTRY